MPAFMPMLYLGPFITFTYVTKTKKKKRKTDRGEASVSIFKQQMRSSSVSTPEYVTEAARSSAESGHKTRHPSTLSAGLQAIPYHLDGDLLDT
jgi:hypothetical protein